MRKESADSVRVFYPQFNQQQLVQRFKERLGVLREILPLSLVVLFGSYARGNYTVASDVDLLIVYKGGERPDAFASAKKALDIPLLEPHVYSESEYERLKETINRMITDGIVLLSEMSEEGATAHGRGDPAPMNGPSMNTEQLLMRLRGLKPEIAERYRVKGIGLFGSFVRGEQGGAGDIDVLVEFEEEADLFDLVGLALFLEEKLQREVDVVPRRALRAELRESVFREVVPL